MTAAKKKKKAASSTLNLREMLTWSHERPWAFWSGATLMAVLLFSTTTYFVWQGVRHNVLAGDDYMVARDSIRITPVPQWLEGIAREETIRDEVYRGMAIDGPLSLMNEDLTERIYNSFSLHPWIAAVKRVAKQHPGTIRVELQYRRPVAMVPTPEGPIPIDPMGIQLPRGGFSMDAATRDYLQVRLIGGSTKPLGMEGERWGDPRIADAAAIAAVLVDTWKRWGLRQIELSSRTPARMPNYPAYDLVTHGGSRIRWGRPPGINIQGEATTAEKLSWIEEHFADHGTLEGNGGTQVLEIPVGRLSARAR